MGRSFVHPAVKDMTIDAVLYALADPIRRNIVYKLLKGDAMNCGNACAELSPSTISFHYKILRESGLVRSEKQGVQVMNTLRRKDLEKKFPGLVDLVLKFHKALPKKTLCEN